MSLWKCQVEVDMESGETNCEVITPDQEAHIEIDEAEGVIEVDDRKVQGVQGTDDALSLDHPFSCIISILFTLILLFILVKLYRRMILVVKNA